MALYKYAQYLTLSQHTAFDAVVEPGSTAANSGIYRCEGCGKEITEGAGRTLPPQNHHQHNSYQGRIRWKLVVCHQG